MEFEQSISLSKKKNRNPTDKRGVTFSVKSTLIMFYMAYCMADVTRHWLHFYHLITNNRQLLHP